MIWALNALDAFRRPISLEGRAVAFSDIQEKALRIIIVQFESRGEVHKEFYSFRFVLCPITDSMSLIEDDRRPYASELKGFLSPRIPRLSLAWSLLHSYPASLSFERKKEGSIPKKPERTLNNAIRNCCKSLELNPAITNGREMLKKLEKTP